MSEELRPCPFCGGEAFYSRKGNHKKSTVVMCEDCGCTLESSYEFKHHQSWNTRDNTELGQEKDIRADREIALELLAKSLKVKSEPHQTFNERLLESPENLITELEAARKVVEAAKLFSTELIEDCHEHEDPTYDFVTQFLEAVEHYNKARGGEDGSC